MSKMSTATLIFFTLLIGAYSFTEKDMVMVQNYLTNYGFLQDASNSLMSSEASLRNAVMMFQDYYNFHPIDGEITQDMLDFMSQKRCGVKDSPTSYALHPTKWQKSVITWHFPRADYKVRWIAEMAFDIWASVTNLTFVRNSYNPDILISFKTLNHTYEKRPDEVCGAELDGKGIILAHAYYPTEIQETSEIHMDADEDWEYGEKISRNTSEINFLRVLVHEIGHSLGLRHSSFPNSIMYSTYRAKAGEPVHLSTDDILGIQNLYGPKIQEEVIPTPPSKNVTISRNETSSDEPKDLCSLRSVDGMLVVDGRMYIFYKKWVWPMNVGSKNYEAPKLITNWLTFLPKNFKRITAIYQRPNSDVVLIAGDRVYQFSVPDLKLRDSHPKLLHEVWKLKEKVKVRGLVHTYTGRTFMFYDDNYYAQMDECYFQPARYGVISNDFKGVPARITSSFRYVNGLIYFFDKSTYYEYNEFTKSLIRAGKFSWDLFNIECVKDSILDQLKNLLSKLSTVMSNSKGEEDEEEEDVEEKE